jgi:cyclic-di-AMP phosphodiesterase PgpH
VNLWQQLERGPDRVATGERRLTARDHVIRVALALAVAVTTYLLFPASPAVDFPLLEVGSVAPDNVIAPFAYTVPKTAAELTRERDDLARAVEPIYGYVPGAADTARAQLAAFFAALTSAASVPPTEAERSAAVQRAAAAQGVQLTPDEATYLAAPARRRAMLSAVDRVFERWLPEGVTATGVTEDARGRVSVRERGAERSVSADSVPAFNGLVARARRLHPDPDSPVGDALYVKLLGAFFRPTLVYDRPATELRRQEMRRTVAEEKYRVRAGEKIVGAHEVVVREQYEKLRALRDELQARRGAERVAGRVTGAVLFDFLLVALFGIALLLFRPAVYASLRSLALFVTVFVVVIVAAALVAHMDAVHTELIPIALAAVIISVMFDPRISVIAAMVLAVLVGGQSVFRGTNALFINLIGGVAAAFSVRAIHRRNDVYFAILPIAAAYALAALAIGLTLDWPWQQIAASAAWGGLNAIASLALAMLLIPPAEQLTGIDTYLRLLEWSDLNRPLMQRLLMEAPGTFQHTVAIANLTEAACNAIGANGLLARVGAYYHDIGKLRKPQYFVENQQRGRNPHDKLKPTTSAAIIRNHVREGVELAEEYKLPKSVVPFITQHHGTGPISYFLSKAKERGDGAVNTAEFAYPGPVPQSAETAVLMLADGVEAAARVVQDPTPEKLRELIDHIVKQRMEQGQLREAPLTLKQIETIKEQFARVLMGSYHSRIDYPASIGGVSAEFAAVGSVGGAKGTDER